MVVGEGGMMHGGVGAGGMMHGGCGCRGLIDGARPGCAGSRYWP